MINRFFISTLVSSTLFVTLSAASTLEIYNDGAKYRYIPIDNYIGFTKGVSANCDSQSISLMSTDTCSDKKRLCKEINIVKDLANEQKALNYESSMLEQLISISKPTDIDASKWIDAAEKIGKRKVELELKMNSINSQLQSASKEFKRQAAHAKATKSKKKCTGELELSIPSGYIGAKLQYEADTTAFDTIQITQYISLNNQSGIDIVAKDAYIYAKSSRLYLKPQHFNPWTAEIRREPDYKKSRRRTTTKANYAREMTLDAMAQPAPVLAAEPRVGAVIQTGFKNYHISGLELPSTGKDIKVKIADYRVPTKCEYITHPYRDTNIYRSCSFVPSSPIESNKWTLRKNKRLISDQAYGEYSDGEYLLNTDIDDEIIITREQIVKQDQSSGIFGGSIRKKDGFGLDITNISNNPKTIKIVERIPRSTTDKIKVKLVSVDGARYQVVGKDGKIVMNISLKPKENRKIKVIFELSYSKDVSVYY